MRFSLTDKNRGQRSTRVSNSSELLWEVGKGPYSSELWLEAQFETWRMPVCKEKKSIPLVSRAHTWALSLERAAWLGFRLPDPSFKTSTASQI